MTKLGKFTSLSRRRTGNALTVVSLAAVAFVLTILTGPTAHAQVFSTIHAFNGADGSFPSAGVTVRAGTLYGTACVGFPSCGPGTVYQITPAGSDWYFTPLFFFRVLGQSGYDPLARVVFGPDNHLYGTTSYGGSPQNGGVVFSLTPLTTICKTANCFSAEAVLHSFTGSPDGDHPGYGDLVWDPMGNIYGTTARGGTSDLGTVFQMTKSGNSWTETPIYSFTAQPDGEVPAAGVILDSNGNVFGTTYQGGLYGFGTIFELTYNVNSGWTETVLYNFQNSTDGQWPNAGLVRDNAGNLYGATSDGGSGGGGTVFELSPVGDTWVFKLLYSFSGGLQDFTCGPYASLALDNSGNLYGTTLCDGANRAGNVFKLTNTQNGWEYNSLHDFTDGSDGAYPISNVTIDTDGTLYGTAESGGNLTCNPSGGCGTVWMIKP